MRYKNYIWILALLALLTGCSSEEVDDTTASVSARLALAVTQTSIPTTRQGGDVVQSTSVRQINLLRKIPFGIPENGSKITVDDIPKSLTESGTTYQYDKSNQKVFFSKEVILVPGTASFLVYGRAAPKGDNAQNGVLQTTITPDGYPADISFSLKQICATTDVPNDAKAIAAYLNRIANAQTTIDGTTYSWKNSTNALLKLLYTNFTGQNPEFSTAAKRAGSSLSISKFVEALRFSLSNQSEHFIGDATATAIRDAIIAEIDNNKDFPANYPGSIGLPDGAAVLMWTSEGGFVPQVETSTEAAINSIDRYCYPAELYYFTNSLIRTSTMDLVNRAYTDETVTKWEDIVSQYQSGGVVTANTQAAAIVDPLQYAVGCLQVKLKKVAPTLKDSQDQDITVTEKAFPLTGIIVDGQHTVGFDFKPQTPLSPDRFIYDNQVKTNGDDYFYMSTTVDESNPVETLVLQSAENDNKVKVILEFQNNSDINFYGANNGVIYRGTKFYMIGTINRPAERTADYMNQVFTQDFTTTLSVKIASLKEAYNVLPDLLSPSLEVGIQITNKWIQSTTTTVPLE